MQITEWELMHSHILALEQAGLVTRTFRRLDPDRQQAVLNAILDEAVAKGPTRLNIKAVAERAGVSVGSLYQYFGKRDAMLDFAVELCGRFMSTAFAQYGPYLAALPLQEALSAYLVGGIEWSQTQVSLVRFFAKAAYQGDPALSERVVQPVATAMRAMVTDILTAAQARGEIRPDVDLAATARIVHALLIAVGDAQLLPYLNTYFQVVDADVSPEGALQAALDLIVQGLGPR